jgi:hypothetical protein
MKRRAGRPSPGRANPLGNVKPLRRAAQHLCNCDVNAMSIKFGDYILLSFDSHSHHKLLH